MLIGKGKVYNINRKLRDINRKSENTKGKFNMEFKSLQHIWKY